MNLGLCYAQLPQQRVLVIDADLRTSGLTSMLDHPSTPGLAEVLAGEVTPDEAIVATNQKNLFVLPAGMFRHPRRNFSPARAGRNFLAHCSEMFKLVLIDTPPILPLADFELISVACDGVLMVVRAHHGQRETLQKTAERSTQRNCSAWCLMPRMSAGRTTTGMGMVPARAEASSRIGPGCSTFIVDSLQYGVSRIGLFEAMRCIQT